MHWHALSDRGGEPLVWVLLRVLPLLVFVVVAAGGVLLWLVVVVGGVNAAAAAAAGVPGVAGACVQGPHHWSRTLFQDQPSLTQHRLWLFGLVA